MSSANSRSSCPAEATTDLLGNLQTPRGPASESAQTAPGGVDACSVAVAPTPLHPNKSCAGGRDVLTQCVL